MADELTKDQAHSIVSDPTHPDHARLYGPNGDGEGGDPVLKAHIEAAYAKANPVLAEQIRTETAALRPEDLKPKVNANEEYRAKLEREFKNWQAEQAQKTETPAGESDSQAVNQKLEAILTEQWGDSYLENSQRAGQALGEIFPTVEEMVEWGRARGIEKNPELQARIVQLLAELPPRR